MKEYQTFVTELKNHVATYSSSENADWGKTSEKYVNGLAYEALRSLISLQERRDSGAFFTGHELALSVLSRYKLKFSQNVVFYDPACGTANLLIAAAQKYCKNLSKNSIPVSFIGTDIHREFVDAAILRLEILRKQRKAYQTYCVEISQRDGLQEIDNYSRATHILINPPFNKVIAPDNTSWAKGSISNAALFISTMAAKVKPGTQVIAILPDVLRSGSRYAKWRRLIATEFKIGDIHLLGQFDKHTDVDVFSVMLTKSEKKLDNQNWNHTDMFSSRIVSDDFLVSVGTVVDNRDKKVGIERPYLVSKGMRGWTTITTSERKRRHTGKFYTSPFVVVKRTSRAGEIHRAIATIVNIPEPVYVDNHLIVLVPKHGKLRSCQSLVKKLKAIETTQFVDEQIRCRHLTVGVVKNIPL